MHSFTPDALRSLHLADTDTRLAALERFTAATLPTVQDEIWRYSRIGELDFASYAYGSLSTSITGAASLSTHDAPIISDHALDLFEELNHAFNTSLCLRIPRGTVLVEPIVITHMLNTDGAACFPRLEIDAEQDSEVTVIERFVSADDIRGIVMPVLHIRASQAARVKYLAINELGSKVWQIANQQSIGERDSSTLLSAVALGGDYARVRTHATLVGQGASTRQVALYFADGSQTHDFRITQEHVAPKTTADLLFKGAVNDVARSVYTGLIKIGPDARGTQAFQTNRNLTLSDGAWAESVPNLEIETNDVKCSHASTVGPIDEEQRFYLESRGIQPDIAERLVVLGFFDEVLGQLPTGDLGAELRERISHKLHQALVPA